MSYAWEGGKGDKNRVNDFSSYRNNYDNIFKKKEEQPMRVKKIHLFLDDVRHPNAATLWGENPPCPLLKKSGIASANWAIVRDYDQFVAFIEKNGIPDTVSFDNDLFDVCDYRINDDQLKKQFAMDGWQEFTIKTGAHCAEYLVKACKARGVPIPKYYIHTANSAARPIIQQILENYE